MAHSQGPIPFHDGADAPIPVHSYGHDAPIPVDSYVDSASAPIPAYTKHAYVHEYTDRGQHEAPEVVRADAKPADAKAAVELGSREESPLEKGIPIPPVAPRPWWKRRRVQLAVVAVVVIVAVVVGCVVGLSKKSFSATVDTVTQGAGDGSSGSTSGQKSLCRGTTCSQLFTAEKFGENLHLLARGQDDAIWTRVHNGASWNGEWTSLGGKFRSQPDAMVWGKSSRLTVLGVSTDSSTIMAKSLRNGTWEQNWLPLNATTGSAVTSCYNEWGDRDFGDLFARSQAGTDKPLIRAELLGESDPDFFRKAEPGRYLNGWVTYSDLGGSVGSSIAVSCRRSEIPQDFVMYQRGTRSVAHMQWRNGARHTGWKDLGGSFSGEPVVVQVSRTDSRIDFFGTGQDRKMYHFSWSEATNYSALESAGAEFQSDPAVVVTTSGRLDLLAVGTDDQLKHRVMVGGKWAADWEDLGVFANSAPYAVALASSPPRIGVFLLGEKKDVLFATWEVTGDLSWKSISKFESIQGSISGSWMVSEA